MCTDDSQADQTHSVTNFINRMKVEDPHAAGEIWQRYFERLLPLARAKLKDLNHRAVDEEDVLLSVFDRFFRAAKENRFAQLEDRDDLWQILLMLTDRKVADKYRQAATQKRSGGETANAEQRSGAVGGSIDGLPNRDPGPEYVAAFNDNLAKAMQRLSEQSTREVALLRMEDFKTARLPSG